MRTALIAGAIVMTLAGARAGAAQQPQGRIEEHLEPHDARNESDRPLQLWVVLCKKCD